MKDDNYALALTHIYLKNNYRDTFIDSFLPPKSNVMATLETLERVVHASTRDRIIMSIFMKCKSLTRPLKNETMIKNM